MSHPSMPPYDHIWTTPEAFVLLLDGVSKHGNHWRAKCPAHGGDNPTSLKIWQGVDSNGNAKTSLHCFARGCKQEDICAAVGVPERNLYAVQEEYGRRPRGYQRSPWIEAWRKGQEPDDPDITARMLLCEMIVSDPEFIQTCAPARQKMWELAQASPRNYRDFDQALRQTSINPVAFWQTLADEYRSTDNGNQDK